MTKSLLAIRHVAFEDLGAFARVFTDSGYTIRYADMGVDDVASFGAPDLSVILGGPIGAYEDDLYPYLKDEIAFIAARLAAGAPTLGICLGAQLMARALGARVYPSPAKEIGWKPLTLNPAGRNLLAPFDGLPVLHWHGDTFDLPPGAETLASPDICAQQAFRLGRHALAFQCHPEAQEDGFERWLIGHAGEIAATPGVSVADLRAGTRAHAAVAATAGRTVLQAWLASCRVRELFSRWTVQPWGGGSNSLVNQTYGLQMRPVNDAGSAPQRASIHHGVAQLDTEGRVTSWNVGASHLTGYDAADMLGQPISMLYSEEDRHSGLLGTILTAARNGHEAEGWRVRKDGSRFWAHIAIDPVKGADGSLTGFVEIIRDANEQHEAEEKLRRSEEQFRVLVQGVTDYAIYMLDPLGHVSSWNPGAQRIKGYRAEEIIGEHFSRFYTPEDRAAGEPARALEIALREGRYEREATRLRKDGSTFLAHVIIDPIRDDNGDLVGFAKITRDVTERKKSQIELELAREALFQSRKMDAVGQLTGGVAHDFNNLLMAILGSLELLEKRLPDDPQMKRLLNNAVQGAQRGRSLIQRMLAFARRQSLDTHPIELGGLVSGMIDLLQRSLGPSVSVETTLPPGLPAVQVDQNQLELALLNLVMNARDAMPDGGRVIISATAEEVGPGHATLLAEGRYVRLAVTDVGEGMDEETLAHATEPFFTTKGIGKGTGLGLPMVHGMSEQMGGRFILKSVKGEGTTAEIWLPLATAAPGAEPARAPEQAKHARALTVLAVDDDMLVLFNTTAMLEEMGHTVIEAHSGAEALAAIKDRQIDLVITDQAMPRMTGAQLAEAIEKERPGTPIILATGYVELPPGAPRDLPILNKPFVEKDLADCLAKVMSRQS